MDTQTNVAAIELPATCPFDCYFCRTPEHMQGDSNAVVRKIDELLESNIGYFYLTSNGETGFFEGFPYLVQKIIRAGAQVGVLCASKVSIIAGLSHVEISYNKYTAASAEGAITSAKKLSIPFAVSLVDEGDQDFIQYAKNRAIEIFGADAILVRAQQPEGKSTQQKGHTICWISPTSRLPNIFPVKAYRELMDLTDGSSPTCINTFGRTVKFLGSEPIAV